MTLEQRLNEAQMELQKAVDEINQLEQAKGEVLKKVIRLDERVRLLGELIKEQNILREQK